MATSITIQDATHGHTVDNVTLQIPMAEQLGLALAFRKIAPSQYANYNFNSMCKFGDVYLGANKGGIFILDSGDSDNNKEIDAAIELFTTDFGIPNQKRIRSFFVGYETDGDITFTVKDDDANERAKTLTGSVAGNKQVSGKVNPGRDGKGRYWMTRIDNVDGSDFSIDTITAVLIVLPKKP